MQRTERAIAWFKSAFGSRVATVAAGTPFTVEFFAAIAVQETYEVWGGLFDAPGLDLDRILELCVGDTIDAPGRSAFPTSKKALLKDPNGAALFATARAALVDVATVNSAYHKVLAANPDKFCHGFGIFQYDLQFAKTDPGDPSANDAAFFLERKWRDFDECLKRFLVEMKRARRAAGYADRATLSHDELVHVAIAYNRGSFDPKRKFRQGHYDKDSGKYYGEMIDTYLGVAERLA